MADALERYRARIARDNERAALELIHDRLAVLLDALRTLYGPNKASIPDLIGNALDHGERLSSELWRRIVVLDGGDA